MEQWVQTLAERTSRAVGRQDANAALMLLTMAAVEAQLCEFASINFVDQGRMVTAGATDPVAAELDDEQYRLGQGLCVQAAVAAAAVHSADVAADPRWPLWGPDGRGPRHHRDGQCGPAGAEHGPGPQQRQRRREILAVCSLIIPTLPTPGSVPRQHAPPSHGGSANTAAAANYGL